MADIITSGLQGGDLVTSHDAGPPPESIRDWVKRHADAVKATPPDNSTLTTTWPKGCSVTTYQQSGESAALHKARHWLDVTDSMVDNPPDPD